MTGWQWELGGTGEVPAAPADAVLVLFRWLGAVWGRQTLKQVWPLCRFSLRGFAIVSPA